MLKRVFNQNLKSKILNSGCITNPAAKDRAKNRAFTCGLTRMATARDSSMPTGSCTVNPTAALMAYYLLEETSEREAVRLIRKKYHVSAQQARADLGSCAANWMNSSARMGPARSTIWDWKRVMPFSAPAPLLLPLDLALTYRCNNDCAHCYNVEHPSLSRLSSGKRGGS